MGIWSKAFSQMFTLFLVTSLQITQGLYQQKNDIIIYVSNVSENKIKQHKNNMKNISVVKDVEEK